MKTRQDFIEADYVEGVYDSKGNQVIRPLTDEERSWLSQFYAETEHGNFAKTSEIEAQEECHRQLVRKMRHDKNKMSGEEVLELRHSIDVAYATLIHLRAETNTFYPDDEDRREIFNKGNRRKEDIFNMAKVTNNLISYDIPEFENFTSKAEKMISPENLVLEYLVRKSPRKVVRRKKKG